MNLLNYIYKAQFNTRRWLIGRYYRFHPSPRIIIRADFAPRKILIVMTGLIGDSVMSVPAIIAARNLWKDARITLLCKKHNHELLAACPHIDDFYELAADPMSLRNRDEIGKLQKWLNDSKFDLSIILLGDQFAHMLAKAKIPVRVGVKGDMLEPCLTYTYDIGSPRTWSAPERLNALRSLGYRIEHIKPQLWVNNEARERAHRKLADLGLKNGSRSIVLHPFGSEERKWWNLDKIPQTAEVLRQNFELDTILVGGKEIVPFVSSDVRKSVIDTTGKLDIQELMAVIDESKAVITTDSGPFHIAGALNKPIIGLFRSRSPELADQYSTANVILGENEQCQSRCGWNFCQAIPCRQLSSISVDSVVRKAEEQIRF